MASVATDRKRIGENRGGGVEARRWGYEPRSRWRWVTVLFPSQTLTTSLACLHSRGAHEGGEAGSREREGVSNQLCREDNFFKDLLKSWGGFLASSRLVLVSSKDSDKFRRVPMFSKRAKTEKL